MYNGKSVKIVLIGTTSVILVKVIKSTTFNINELKTLHKFEPQNKLSPLNSNSCSQIKGNL